MMSTLEGFFYNSKTGAYTPDAIKCTLLFGLQRNLEVSTSKHKINIAQIAYTHYAVLEVYVP